jgi:uncharacterized protein
MMKKLKILIGAVFILLFMSVNIVNAYAADDTQSKQYVIDDADLFTDKEESKLESACKKASANCETDVVIITLNQGLDGTTLDNYVRNIITLYYGYDDSKSIKDAIVYVIDMKSRADRIVTSGNAQTDISQSELDGIRENAEEKLSDAKYYKGCVSYINGVQSVMGNSISYKLTMYMPQKIIISLIVAVVVVLIMMHNAKAKMTVNGTTYTKEHRFDVRQRRDQFINTTVVKRHIDNNHGGGGGGGHSGGGNSGSSGGHF